MVAKPKTITVQLPYDTLRARFIYKIIAIAIVSVVAAVAIDPISLAGDAMLTGTIFIVGVTINNAFGAVQLKNDINVLRNDFEEFKRAVTFNTNILKKHYKGLVDEDGSS